MDPINSAGQVVYGAAVPVEVESYTKDILAGMRQKQAEENKAMEEERQRRKEAKAVRDKYAAGINKMVITQDQGILPMHQQESLAMGAELMAIMKEELQKDPDSNPYYNDRLTNAEAKFGSQMDMWQSEKKANDASGLIAVDQKKQGNYDINHDALKAAYETDSGASDRYYKSLAKFHSGDETKTDLFPVYGGVGILRPKDTTPWDLNTIKYIKGISIPTESQDLGGGKYKTTTAIDSPEKQKKVIDDFMLGEGEKNAQSLSAQQQAVNPSYSIQEARKVVSGLAADELDRRRKEMLKGGGGGAKGYDEKLTEKMFFSDYQPKGTNTEVRGFNVGFKGSNKGLKADLQQGNDVLKDVDLKTVYKGDDGKIKAIVMQTVVEERPMNDDEKKKETANAKMQLREPVYTKTTSSEKPKEIDFSVGSNNYNTIVKQYPGVEAKVQELVNTKSAKTETKSGGLKKGDKKQFKEGAATYNGTKWVLDK